MDFDYAPVISARRVVGRVGKTHLRPGSNEKVDLAMQPLSDKMLVSADAQLHDLMPALLRDPFLFVVDKTHIGGLVTPSDFNKESARAYVFLLLTDLEIRLAAALRAGDLGQEDLVAELPPRDREIVRSKYERQRKRGVVADYIACLSFSLLIRLASVEPKVLQSFGYAAGADFRAELGEMSDLRNEISHSAGDLITNRRGLARVIRLETRLRSLLGGHRG